MTEQTLKAEVPFCVRAFKDWETANQYAHETHGLVLKRLHRTKPFVVVDAIYAATVLKPRKSN